MSTIQIIAIAVAAVIVLLLIAALLATRRRATSTQSPAEDAPPDVGSFLDDDPQDTLAGLGKAEQPADEPVAAEVDEAGGEAEPSESADAETPSPTSDEDALGAVVATEAIGVAAPEDAEVTDETPAAEVLAGPAEGEPRPATEIVAEGGETASPEAPAAPVAAAAAEAADGRPVAASEPPASTLVPLSDIIVTTSSKLVDLNDPDVRRMLTDLIKLEVDQAIECRRQGQTVDAVMQLTEAEKISRSLGLKESCERIHSMIDEFNRMA